MEHKQEWLLQMAEFLQDFQLSDPEFGSDSDETWWNYEEYYSTVTNQIWAKSKSKHSPIS